MKHRIFKWFRGLATDSVDIRLLGRWNTSDGTQVLLTTEDNWWDLFEHEFEISTDGSALKLPSDDNNSFTRISSESSTIAGRWQRDSNPLPAITNEWIEFFENTPPLLPVNPDISSDEADLIKWQWGTENEPEYTLEGYYQVDNSTVKAGLLSGNMECDITGQSLLLILNFGGFKEGTYTVATDGNSWTWDLPEGPTTFTKVI